VNEDECITLRHLDVSVIRISIRAVLIQYWSISERLAVAGMTFKGHSRSYNIVRDG